ncbi:MAG: hypothetical protein QOI16_3487, partial [Pseudonocardiales bacterium]|nr:hypothetical protein [Pseudonocardiales bacterium]
MPDCVPASGTPLMTSMRPTATISL